MKTLFYEFSFGNSLHVQKGFIYWRRYISLNYGRIGIYIKDDFF